MNHFLIIINKNLINSEKIFNQYVLPQLKKKICNCTIAENIDSIFYFNDYDGIIAIGGDGTLVPIIYTIVNHNLLLPIRHIPAGSGNGLSRSFLHEKKIDYNIENACILDKEIETIDMSLFILNNKQISFLSITWGIISDIDFETEWMRYLGEYRFTLGAIYFLYSNQSYYGQLDYLDENNKLITITGEFIYFVASNTSHISTNAYSMPFSKLGDDIIHITYLKKPFNRFKLLQILLSLSEGTHLKYLHYIKTKKFCLKTNGGRIMSDGENIDTNKIDVEIHPKKIKLF